MSQHIQTKDFISFTRSAWERRGGRSRVRVPAPTTRSVEHGIPTGTVGTSMGAYAVVFSENCHRTGSDLAAGPQPRHTVMLAGQLFERSGPTESAGCAAADRTNLWSGMGVTQCHSSFDTNIDSQMISSEKRTSSHLQSRVQNGASLEIGAPVAPEAARLHRRRAWQIHDLRSGAVGSARRNALWI